MGFCIVVGCNSRSDKHAGMKFHIMPKNGEMRAKWIRAIGRAERDLPRSGSVCYKHFLPRDYSKSRSGMSATLNKKAIPSVNVPAGKEGCSWNDRQIFAMNADSLELDTTNSSSMLEFEESKDLPALNCVDLFSMSFGSPAADETNENSNGSLNGTSDLTPDLDCGSFKEIPVDDCIASKLMEVDDDTRLSSHLKLSSSENASSSPLSYYSSTESVTSSASASLKRKRLRKCFKCDIEFRKKRDLLSHIFQHVEMPVLSVAKLSDDHEVVREYLQEVSLQRRTPTEHGSLKLKLKYSGAQNFEVVPPGDGADDVPKPNLIRVVKTEDLKSSPSSTPDALKTMKPNPEPRVKNEPLDNNTYFSCPPLDGLEQFTADLNPNEGTDDLLKRLLAGGHQDDIIAQDMDWPGSNSSEFISLDSLAHMCPVCHMRFTSAHELFVHKKETLHDYHHQQQQQHPSQPPQLQPIGGYRPSRPSPAQQYHGPMYQQHPRPPSMFPPRYQMNPRPPPRPPLHMGHYLERRANPPPLYRGPNHQMFAAHDNAPPMYRTVSPVYLSHNGHPPPPHPHPEHMRQPIFLKSRLQRAVRAKSANTDQSPSNSPPVPGVILSPQTAVRPRFLHPQAAGGSPTQLRPGLPIIQSVHSGPSVQNFQEQPKTIQINESITLSLKGKEANKNPKEVANMLATRGIIVTQKSNKTTTAAATSGGAEQTQEAVQKLQLNNAVSIISKKKDDGGAAATDETETTFLPCPVVNCKEKFLTPEGLSRHTSRFHSDIPRPHNQNPLADKVLRAFKCRQCPAIFSSPEGVLDHQRKKHPAKSDEMGIPVIDLRNEETKRKLAALGITSYIPLGNKASGGLFGFPIVNMQNSSNPSICNLGGLGTSSVLSLGPIKQIPVKITTTSQQQHQ